MKDPIVMERETKSGRMKFSFTLGEDMNLEDIKESLIILEETLIFFRDLTPREIVH